MGKKVVVQGDMVSGTDTHAVAGLTSSSPPSAYTGKGKYPYAGAMTTGLSDFVTIADMPVALVNSGSTLKNPHVPTAAQSFDPTTVNPTTAAFSAAPDGKGVPSPGAGSNFVTVAGQAVLLDGDTLDTCGVERGHGNSSVAASGQDFVVVGA